MQNERRDDMSINDRLIKVREEYLKKTKMKDGNVFYYLKVYAWCDFSGVKWIIGYQNESEKSFHTLEALEEYVRTFREDITYRDFSDIKLQLQKSTLKG